MGYRFRPWREAKAMAPGPAILGYIRETAAEYAVDKAIRYNHRVRRASWSSDQARWTVDVEIGPQKTPVQLTCNFLYLCTGYYDYESGYTPEWPGVSRFRGTIVHPQKWPEDLGYAGKRIVVIGSGATAVTLVPAMAERAAHVTMLQRSPSYIVTRPAEDPVAKWPRRSSTTSRERGPKFSSGWWREACAIISERNTTPSISRHRTTRGTSDCASSRMQTSSTRYEKVAYRW
jgi:cation diffusion facilitator CzcD-associated flavoprotein CzcO